MPNDFLQTEFTDKENCIKWVITNYLFHIPLYGFWVISIDIFDDEEIGDILMTNPATWSGPHQTYEEALAERDLLIDYIDKN